MSTQSHISGYHATTTAISSCVVQRDPTILEKENSTIRSCISSLTALRDNLLVTESPGLGWSSHLLQLVGGRGEKEDRIDEHRDVPNNTITKTQTAEKDGEKANDTQYIFMHKEWKHRPLKSLLQRWGQVWNICSLLLSPKELSCLKMVMKQLAKQCGQVGN